MGLGQRVPNLCHQAALRVERQLQLMGLDDTRSATPDCGQSLVSLFLLVLLLTGFFGGLLLLVVVQIYADGGGLSGGSGG